MMKLLQEKLEEGLLSEIDLCLADSLCSSHDIDDSEIETLLALVLALSRQGHLCTGAEQLRELSSVYGETLVKSAISAMDRLPDSLISHAEDLDPLPTTPLCKSSDQIYLQRLWLYESVVLRELRRLVAHKPQVRCDAIDFVRKVEVEGRLQKEQAQAIEQALVHSVICITGGPGTGKTYTAGLLIQALKLHSERPLKFALAAPTGKAAAQLQASLSRVSSDLPGARTLHAHLQLRPQQLVNPLDSPVQLDADVVLVDESSMIDVDLMARLLGVVKSGARLILLGDKDQLPPVEAGCLFADFTGSCQSPFHVAKLRRCMRTDLQELNEFAQAVNAGDDCTAWELLQNGTHVTHETLPSMLSKSALQERLVRRLEARFQHSRDLSAREDAWFAAYQKFRVLSPLRQGYLGVDSINQALRKAAARQGQHVTPIMVTANHLQLELFNGECGLLVQSQAGARLSTGDYALFQVHDGSLRRIPALALPRFDFAYALSVHKSQGSEYEEVQLLMPEGSERFGRQVLYTAATRARKKLCIVGEEAVIRETIRRSSKRRSGLAARF